MMPEPMYGNTEMSSVSDMNQPLESHECEPCAGTEVVPNKRARDCHFGNCSKRRTFGPIGGKRNSALFCGEHGTDRAVYADLNSNKCGSLGCGKTASFGEPGGNGKRLFCAKHVDHRLHVDLASKKCGVAGCITRASFGLPGGKRMLCAKHSDRSVHVDIVNPKCGIVGCGTIACFGEPGGKRMFCGSHKKTGHIDIVSDRCVYDGCMLRPCYGFPDTRSTHCVEHHLDGQLNVVKPRCMSCPLQPGKFIHLRSAVQKCRECDPTLWPRLKKQEEAFAAFVASEFGNSGEYRTYERELTVPLQGCGVGVDRSECGQEVSQRTRLDFVFDTGPSCVVVVEVDEDQHKQYCVPSEIARVNATAGSLLLGGTARHVRFVRFNPDDFHVDGALRFVAMKKRYKRVAEVIREAQRSDLPANVCSIQYMYYDVEGKDGDLCIKDEIDVNIVEACMKPIID